MKTRARRPCSSRARGPTQQEPAPRAHDDGSASARARRRDDARRARRRSRTTTAAARDFNRWAVRANLPVYWIADTNSDKADRARRGRVAAVLSDARGPLGRQRRAHARTFETAYARSSPRRRRPADRPTSGASLVGEDLDQGRATLVRTDFTSCSADDKAFVGTCSRSPQLIDELYEMQNGSRRARRQGRRPIPRARACSAATAGRSASGRSTENDPQLLGDPGRAEADRRPSIRRSCRQERPVDRSATRRSATTLEKAKKRATADAIRSPSCARSTGKLVAVPYTDAYKDADGGDRRRARRRGRGDRTIPPRSRSSRTSTPPRRASGRTTGSRPTRRGRR